MDSNVIRQRFVKYYEGLGYQQLPRAPLLDASIPMSFVMSAGLVQVETSLSQSPRRDGNQYVLVQECFRHFDLDKVGSDDVHLSLFEMPGAFEFGPNGKTETIRRMWRLATMVLGVNRERIWVSYFKGGDVMGNPMPEDDLARRAWLEVGVPEERVVGLGAESNYWIQGNGIEGSAPPRKCGPNTELFYDRGRERACGADCRPGCKCGRFVEFSNSLFICRELGPDRRSFLPMNDPFTETVIGSERVAMILQNAPSVFDTDLYQPIIESIRAFVRADDLPAALAAASERVIADYLKGLYCLVADGAPPPGKDGRQRIIKMLIRGVITRQLLLGIQSPNFLPVMLDCVSQNVSSVCCDPWVKARLLAYFTAETERFSKTLARGQRCFQRLLHKNQGQTLTGCQIAYLEKEWGMPHLITRVELDRRGLAFRENDYHQSLVDDFHWRAVHSAGRN